MIPKHYPIEKIETVASEIAAAPALPPKSLTQEQALRKLAKEIKVLHEKKNYAANEIVSLLKKNGIKVTVKEVKNIIEKSAQKTAQKKTQNIT